MERHISTRSRSVERLVPLFKSYLFVAESERWIVIPRAVGVIDVLRTSGDRPAQLSESVIEQIRKQEREGVVRLPARLKRGDPVRIVGGPLLGQLALFDDMRPHQRVAALLALFGSQRRIELSRRAVLRV